MTKRAIFVALCALAIATAAAASTSDDGKQQIRLTSADNAAARHVVLREADFGGVTGWSGGAKKPDLSSSGPRCANFHPKYSDLVLTGIAESEFQNSGVYIDDEVQMLKTAPMVRLDWQRSVRAPACFRVSGPTSRSRRRRTRRCAASRSSHSHALRSTPPRSGWCSM
jgi:hypothetical protein